MPSSARKNKNLKAYDAKTGDELWSFQVGWGSGASPMTYVFFCKDSAATEIYTLSLHDALPITAVSTQYFTSTMPPHGAGGFALTIVPGGDRKGTRLNSSHSSISYAVFCLKKKKQETWINWPISKNSTGPCLLIS